MARYRFVETCEFTGIVTQTKANGEQITQTFTPEIGGLAKAIAYAESHGKRTDLADYFVSTEVTMWNGAVVYSVKPELIS